MEELLDLGCETSCFILLCVLCILGLVINFAGYHIYREALGLLAFLLAFAAEASVGASWIARSSGDRRTVEKVIVVLCCLAWAVLGAVICRKLADILHRALGFFFGAIAGFVLVQALVHVLSDPVDEALGRKWKNYMGWEQFTSITLGVPAAVVLGYLLRDTVKYCIMLATTLVGTAVAIRSFITVMACADVETDDLVMRPSFQIVAAAALVVLGFLTQIYSQPKVRANRCAHDKAVMIGHPV